MSIEKKNIKPIENDTRVIKLATHPDGNFTITPKTIHKDIPQNIPCWGLYEWLLSLKPNIEITVSYVAKSCGISRPTAWKYLEMIRAAGYALGDVQTHNFVVFEFNINEVNEDMRKRIENHVKSLERTSKQTERTTKRRNERSEIFWHVVGIWNEYFEGHRACYTFKQFDSKLYGKMKIILDAYSEEDIRQVFWYARKESDGIMGERFERYDWTLSGALNQASFQLLHAKYPRGKEIVEWQERRKS